MPVMIGIVLLDQDNLPKTVSSPQPDTSIHHAQYVAKAVWIRSRMKMPYTGLRIRLRPVNVTILMDEDFPRSLIATRSLGNEIENISAVNSVVRTVAGKKELPRTGLEH